MSAKDGQNINEDAIGMGCLFFGVIGLILFPAFVWPGYYYENPNECVELPNGLLISSAPNPKPDILTARKIYILKKQDGTVIVPKRSQLLFITNTTVHGNAGRIVDSEATYNFAYRPDIGFVLESKNPETYLRIKLEAGSRIPFGDKFSRYSSSSVYENGIKSKYWRTDCPVNIFPK